MQQGRKKGRGSKGLNVYSNLTRRYKTRKDQHSRRRAEYLATLPKHPLKRMLYRAHPKRFFAYWFSREGGVMALKIAGVGTLLLVLMFGALFAYYRRELDAIRPGELSKRVKTTVNRYTDRNGVVLYEDKGDGDYKLVVESKDIAAKMKEATVAIEDKDFYKHSGFSLSGIGRALVNNFSGGGTQGGSTLTQQLVKQVFFADEAQQRGLGGIPRKIKEAILAIEVERMYNKDQILTLYLNESPYGGRRNGVESAAQTYFGKTAKDLTIAESALLAGIPQQPGRFDPYSAILDPDSKQDLLNRQHTVLDYMAEQGYASKAEVSAAKNVSVLDTLRPASDQYKDIKAPHFVEMVRSQLKKELGSATVGNGGLTIKTTLDVRAQDLVDKSMTDLFASKLPDQAHFNNGAMTVIDAPTGQILALRGSRDYNYPDFGYVNHAYDAFLQPGSSIKPLVYASLFKQRSGLNYGAGSPIVDENINSVLGNGADLHNFYKGFRGSSTIRIALAESRNIPAVKAYLIDGRDNVLNTIHTAGDTSYCTDGADQQASWSLAIGGCGARQTEHTNAFATLARMGAYKPVASVLEVKNSDGQVIQKWKDSSKQVMDSQIPYMISDILSDQGAHAAIASRTAPGFSVPGVKTATKTGTSNIEDKPKDLWMMSYSPRAVTSIWVGNTHRPQGMNASGVSSSNVGPAIDAVMGPLHTQIFKADGSWKSGDWFTKPAGIQTLTVSGRSDIFPSWYSKTQIGASEKMVFDKISKKKATDCTPDSAKIEVTVQKIDDPVTKKTSYLAEGYDPNASDDLHKCDDVKPFVSNINSAQTGTTYRITASITQGTHALQSVEFKIGDQVQTVTATSTGDYAITYTPTTSGPAPVTITVTDSASYSSTASRTISFTADST